jgi:ABC-type amino acid transport system permease subunit
MAKLILQPVPADRGIETTRPCLEVGAWLKLLAIVTRVVKPLAVYLQSRRRRATATSFIPRQSCDRESRLEFERFMHW